MTDLSRKVANSMPQYAANTIAIALFALAASDCAVAQDVPTSPYGPDDTVGAINNITPQIIRSAADLVKTGKVYSLAIPTGPDTPRFGTRNYQIQVQRIRTGPDVVRGTNKANGNDDLLITWLGIGTQLDGFAHVGIDSVHYNAVPTENVFRPNGVIKYGIHEVPPIATRGVLLDMAAYFETDVVEGGTAINRAEIEAASRAQGVQIRKGDVVLLHTGWHKTMETDPERYMRTEPGLGLDGAEYLVDLGVVAIGADTWGVEVDPEEDPLQRFPVHGYLLTKNGVYILENIKTDELARDGAYEFLFVVAAPKFVGAVQSVVHPVAIR